MVVARKLAVDLSRSPDRAGVETSTVDGPPAATPAPASAVRPLGERWTGRLLTVGWAAVGLVVVVSAVDTIRTGWAPVIDTALVAAMTVDSVSLDPPLVGMPTSLGLEAGAPLSHPGPLGFWLLALPTTVLGEPGDGLVFGSALVSLASLAGIALLLRRRGDIVLEALGLGLVAGMVFAIGARTFTSPLNPHLGILPLLLCTLATWGVLAGRHRQLWVVVLAGSLAAQTHLGYVLLVAALVVVTAASLAFDAARSSGAGRGRLTRRVIPVGVVAGLLAWSGPIVDQLFGSGNLFRLVRSQARDRAAAGFDHGLDLAVEMTSVPPRWLLGHARDQSLADPSAVRIALSLTATAWVVGLLVRAFRRRDRGLASLAIVSLVSLAAATVTSARVVNPTTIPFFDAESALLYRLFWWPVGVVFALTALWGTYHAVSAVVSGRGAGVDRRRLAVPLVAGLVAGVALVAHFSYTGPFEVLEGYYRREITNAEAIADLPGSPESVVLRFAPEGTTPAATTTPEAPWGVWDLGPHQRYGQAINLVAQLRLRGITVRFADEPDDGIVFMRAYRDEHSAEGDEDVDLLYLVGPDVHEDPPPGYRRLSHAGAGPGEEFNVLTVPSAVFVPSS
jgi:hypothetical protein